MDASLVLFSQSLMGTPLHQVLIRSNAENSNLTGAKSAIRKSNQSAVAGGNKLKAELKFDILPLPRSFFNEHRGGEILAGLSRISQDQKTLSAVSALQDKYVASASFHALHHYLEKSFNLRLEGDELVLNYHQPQEYMSIGAQTCKALSLFPMVTG